RRSRDNLLRVQRGPSKRTHLPKASSNRGDPFRRIFLRIRAQTRFLSFAKKPSHVRLSDGGGGIRVEPAYRSARRLQGLQWSYPNPAPALRKSNLLHSHLPLGGGVAVVPEHSAHELPTPIS